jgi:hypothetical protein
LSVKDRGGDSHLAEFWPSRTVAGVDGVVAAVDNDVAKRHQRLRSETRTSDFEDLGGIFAGAVCRLDRFDHHQKVSSRACMEEITEHGPTHRPMHRLVVLEDRIKRGFTRHGRAPRLCVSTAR